MQNIQVPSKYSIKLGDTFKNVNQIELKGVVMPKSSYNVHSSNNKIDFAVGDFITGFRIINRGSGYTSSPNVIIGAPPAGGTQATASAIINTYGQISNIIIISAGSGYIPSRPPFIFLDPPQNTREAIQPQIVSTIGTHYTATLRTGEYDIGGNPFPPTTESF